MINAGFLDDAGSHYAFMRLGPHNMFSDGEVAVHSMEGKTTLFWIVLQDNTSLSEGLVLKPCREDYIASGINNKKSHPLSFVPWPSHSSESKNIPRQISHPQAGKRP